MPRFPESVARETKSSPGRGRGLGSHSHAVAVRLSSSWDTQSYGIAMAMSCSHGNVLGVAAKSEALPASTSPPRGMPWCTMVHGGHDIMSGCDAMS